MADGSEDDWLRSLLHTSSLLFNRSFYVKVSLKHRSRETRIKWLFRFAPEKLGRFEKQCKDLSAFQNEIFFFQFPPAEKLVRSPVVFALRQCFPTFFGSRHPY